MYLDMYYICIQYVIGIHMYVYIIYIILFIPFNTCTQVLYLYVCMYLPIPNHYPKPLPRLIYHLAVDLGSRFP